MKTKRLITAALLALSTLPAAALAGTTTICHIPPGNPDNAHAITVSDAAVATHIAQHGDRVLSEGAECGAPAGVVPNNELSAAVEICTPYSDTGRRLDVTGLGSVQTSNINCGG